MWQVHVMAHVYGARAVLPSMIARGDGYILTTASAAGLLTQMDSVTYAITKHAAVALAEWMAINHHHQGDPGVGAVPPGGAHEHPRAARRGGLGRGSPARPRPGRRCSSRSSWPTRSSRPWRRSASGCCPTPRSPPTPSARPTTSTAGWPACAASRPPGRRPLPARRLAGARRRQLTVSLDRRGPQT